MLKIKNEVNLKELEKFGFVFLQNYYVVLNSKYGTIMYIDKERCVISSLNFSTFLSDLELYTNILFDLIQAGLVEKVEEQKCLMRKK